MELVKFRIKNYKSIVDSGDCYFSKQMTVLAGKNESGKTSILEALEDFHEGKTIRDTAKPIRGDGVPEVSITFNLAKDEINELLAAAGVEQVTTSDAAITLTKKYGVATYSIDPESRGNINLPNNYNETAKLAQDTYKKIESAIRKTPNALKTPKHEKQKLSEFKNELVNFKTQVVAASDIPDEVRSQIKEEAETLENSVDEYYAREKRVTAFVAELVKSQLPYFILFSSFEDEFPQSIDFASLAANDWAKDLEQVSDFRIAKITSTNDQERRNHQESVNAEFTDKFKKFWTQDEIKLQIEKEGQKINFWIDEGGTQYLPSQRSKGQQWYMSFYIKIVARLMDGKPNVILIDEPGLYLHAKAQKDLLAVLLEHSSTYPVIFSTHSPYLITEETIENVRLVEKPSNKEGTKILGKIHAHATADKETLTPILTAIGLGMNDSITNLEQKDNVVVEGPEDVFYLQAFKRLVDDRLATNFINGGGASNTGMIGAILEGWGANVSYLFDNDQGKVDGEKRLGLWKVMPEAIKIVLKEKSKTIADVLSVDDFKKYVLEKPESKYTTSNSEYIKTQKLDKVLLARKFLQKVKTEVVAVDKASKKNIEELFKAISFKNEN